jgi:hypothetical protein
MKSYKDITILKFQEIQAAIEMNIDNEIAQWYNILSLITDQPKEHYMALKFGEFKKVCKEYEWILSERMPDEWVKSFEVGGEWYIVMQNATDWNTEQFINMSTFTKDRSQIINNLHRILAAMCVKEKGEIITLPEMERREKLFQDNLNILIAYPIGFFFAAFLAKLSQTTQYSSHLTQMQNAMKMNLSRMDSIVSGDGIM